MVATRRNATAENIENSPFNPYGSEIPENMAGKNSKKKLFFELHIFYLMEYKKYGDEEKCIQTLFLYHMRTYKEVCGFKELLITQNMLEPSKPPFKNRHYSMSELYRHFSSHSVSSSESGFYAF